MRVLFAGGGTGGHVYPALAVAEFMAGAEMLFVGSQRGIEEGIVRGAGLEYRGLPIEGLHRRLTAENLLFPVRLATALAAAWALVRAFRPQVVLGTGGFASAPPVLAAQLRGVPTLLQEQNAYPGVTTRLLARRACEVHIAFQEAAARLPRSAEARTRLTGNPVRGSLVERLGAAGSRAQGAAERRAARARIEGLDADLPVVLVFGGSQGSRLLNTALAAFLEAGPDAVTIPFQILWATGRKLHQEVLERQLPAEPALPVQVRPYLEEISVAYAAADLVVCRAGAITCAELALVGRPALLVPLASAAGDHQGHNAAALAGAGAARMLEERRLREGAAGGRELGRMIGELMADRAALERMAGAARALARPDAARTISERLRALAGGARS